MALTLIDDEQQLASPDAQIFAEWLDVSVSVSGFSSSFSSAFLDGDSSDPSSSLFPFTSSDSSILSRDVFSALSRDEACSGDQPDPVSFIPPPGFAFLVSPVKTTSAELENLPPAFETPSDSISRLFVSPLMPQSIDAVQFGDHYTLANAWASPGLQDVSPILRASSSAASPTPWTPRRSLIWRRPPLRDRSVNTSFMDRLKSSIPPGSGHGEEPSSTIKPTLKTPCKLRSGSALHPPPLRRPPVSTVSPSSDSSGLPDPFLTPGPRRDSLTLKSPLSPLTPLTSPEESEEESDSWLKKRKRFKEPESPTPLPRNTRMRSALIRSLLGREPSVQNVSPSKAPTATTDILSEAAFDTSSRGSPQFTTRKLSDIVTEQSPRFPLFYRRFPASSYLQLADSKSPCTLFSVRHPGGNYNPPRTPWDLYTPRFVKGKGVEKVGLCPICIETPERGGESKKVWLAMKFSAFKCFYCYPPWFCYFTFFPLQSYHMQYAHGISASTGLPFSPPVAFRTTERPQHSNREKPRIQEGKCHKCHKWVAVEGVKDLESKVKEIFWWKHASACHQDSSIDDEDEMYEKDEVYDVLVELCS